MRVPADASLCLVTEAQECNDIPSAAPRQFDVFLRPAGWHRQDRWGIVYSRSASPLGERH